MALSCRSGRTGVRCRRLQVSRQARWVRPAVQIRQTPISRLGPVVEEACVANGRFTCWVPISRLDRAIAAESAGRSAAIASGRWPRWCSQQRRARPWPLVPTRYPGFRSRAATARSCPRAQDLVSRTRRAASAGSASAERVLVFRPGRARSLDVTWPVRSIELGRRAGCCRGGHRGRSHRTFGNDSSRPLPRSADRPGIDHQQGAARGEGAEQAAAARGITCCATCRSLQHHPRGADASSCGDPQLRGRGLESARPGRAHRC